MEHRVLIVGLGKMGTNHARVLSQMGLQGLSIYGYDIDPDKRIAFQKAVPDSNIYNSLESAVLTSNPTILVNTTNTPSHASVYRDVFNLYPDIRCVMGEKNFTETYQEALEIAPQFKGKIFSMNTVIDYSPVVDDLGNYFNANFRGDYPVCALSLISWGKDRTKDSRFTPGVIDDYLHGVHVAQRFMENRDFVLHDVRGVQGPLTEKLDVLFDLSTSFNVGPSSIKTHNSFAWYDQDRRVSLFFTNSSGKPLCAAEMEFDVPKMGDILRLYHPENGGLRLLFETAKQSNKLITFWQRTLDAFENPNNPTKQSAVVGIEESIRLQKLLEAVHTFPEQEIERGSPFSGGISSQSGFPHLCNMRAQQIQAAFKGDFCKAA